MNTSKYHRTMSLCVKLEVLVTMGPYKTYMTLDNGPLQRLHDLGQWALTTLA